ncbi:MAG TPA: cupin domain-containing protein [Dehalococcoidia bacterium]
MSTEANQTGGLRVVRPHQRDRGTAQTPGMDRAAGVSAETAGARRLWLGHVVMGPGVRSGAHHHGEAESGIYVIHGRARFRFGPRLEQAVDAGPGDFVFVPPGLVHQEINLSAEEPVEMIVGRDRQENMVVNVEVPEAAGP